MFAQVFGDKANTAEFQAIRHSWAIGDFRQLPFVQVISAADMNGADGAYASSTQKIYLSDSLFQSGAASVNSVLGAAGVLTEETFHWLDDRVGTDTQGDEGEIAKGLLFGVSLSDSELLRIKNEDDRGFINVAGQSVIVEQAAIVPTSLQFNLNSTSLKSIDTLSINGGWVYDGNGATDLSRVDFWVQRANGSFVDVADVTKFSAHSSDNRWGGFNYSLGLSSLNLGAGNTTLWAKAYDKSGASTAWLTKSFSVTANVAPTSLQFITNKSFYKVGDTLSLTNSFVYDGNGASDLSKVDFWLKKDSGNWQDISDVSTFKGTTDNRLASFSYSLSNLQKGNYTLLARAYDKSGAYSDALQKNFSVFSYYLGEGSNSSSLFENAFNRINGIAAAIQPITSAYRWGNGWTQQFTKTTDGSKMFLMSGDGVKNAYWLQSSNLGEYQSLGGAIGTSQNGRTIFLGYPTSDENKIQRSDGKLATRQSFSADNGKALISYLYGVGSVATWGAIGSLYTDTGGASNWVGMPTRREYSWGGGFRTDFENGYIFHWKGTTGKAHTSFMLKDAGGTSSAEKAVVTAQSFEDKFVWTLTGSGPIVNNNDFTKWVMSSGLQPNLNSSINCWEMVLFSAYQSGLVNRQWLTNLYGTSNLSGSNLSNWYANLPSKMSISRQNYNFNSWNQGLKRGDIVFFNGSAHVAIATGTKDRYGNDEVISHWIPNNNRVEVTTIKALKALPAAASATVTFGRPIWN